MKTKTILLLILNIICITNIYADLKYFLPHSDAYISVLDRRYSFDGDTIMNDNRYTKVYVQHGTSETDYDEPRYYAAVREDTIAEKIYCIQVDDDIERLVADFSLQAGDEISACSFWFGIEEQAVKIVLVDSVLINNQYRRRINIASAYSRNDEIEDSWVEGIGSIIHGLFFSMARGVPDATDEPVLLCMHVNNSLIYQNPLYNTCYVRNSGVNLDQNLLVPIRIYPTLANDYIFIEKDMGMYTYKIFNSLGISVLSGSLSSSEIRVSSLPHNIYYIILYNNNQSVYSTKFIKL